MLKHMLLRDKMLMSRFGLVLGSALWGIQLLIPASLFPTTDQIAAGASLSAYVYMALIAPEYVWGTLFLVHSMWAGYTLVTGERNHVTLAADGVLGCVLWTTATVCCYAAYWPRGIGMVEASLLYNPPAAMSADIVLSFFAWWYMIRAWAEEEGMCNANTTRK